MSKEGKRQILNIGPGLIIALGLSTALVSLTYKQTKKQPAGPPIIEHHIIISSDAEKLGPTPEVTFILDHAKDLVLTKDQLSRIKKLDSDWKKFSEPKLAQANEAALKTNAYLADSKANRKTPIAQIQDNARPIIELSGEISACRHRLWDQAMKLLTPEQRKVVQTKRQELWTERMKRLSGRK